MGPKTLPTIWYTYMTFVTKYQISAINSYWEKCDEKYLGRTEGQTEVKQYPPPSGSGGKKIIVTSQTSYRYTILWVAFLDPSDSYFLLTDLVGFYTHWTYMHIFRHIFLSNYWWQKSDIWSQASYRYPISWEAFLDPSDSYFLFADLVGFYTHKISAINSYWEKCDEKYLGRTEGQTEVKQYPPPSGSGGKKIIVTWQLWNYLPLLLN
jgi:hypothetical protein